MLPETRRDMSMTRTPSSGHPASGSKTFWAMLIGAAYPLSYHSG